MSAAAEASAKPKSKKKLLVIVLALVVLLAAAGGGAWFFLKKPPVEDDDEEVAEVSHSSAKEDEHAPTFLPIDNLVVNLADPGGERFAQIGITFQVVDAKASDKLKERMPSIRNAILLLASQRTAEQLLQREGKEKLARDILGEASRPFGYGPEPEAAEGDHAPKKKKKKSDKAEGGNPLRGVFFSSFIIQ